MKSTARRMLIIVASLALALVAGPVGAHPDEGDHDDAPGEAGGHTARESTKNIHALGHSEHPAQFFGVPAAEREISSDIAFWGRFAIHGNYDGFRIVDISSPDDPILVSHPRCNGDQGDIVVWQNVVVRSWNSPAPEGRQCMGEPVPVGFEGVHIFDISDPANPALLTAVELPCGSHTATLAGIDAGDLIIYSNNSSSDRCADGTRVNDDPVGDFMDIIAVPLEAPENAVLIRRQPLAGPEGDIRTGCHDVGVILGDINKAAGACNDTINVWDITDLRDPRLLFTITEPGVGVGGRWHSAAFTWDGEVIAAGWEPGGGAQARCRSDSPDVDKSKFFYDANTGEKLGQWVLPRPQDGAGENCTIHNYNVVPLRSDRYVAVGGHYQAGTWVVDFTDPANPATVAFSDPEPIEPVNLGGAWSTYHYNGFSYESEIQSGLNVFRVSDRALAGEIRLPFLNPQTQDPALLPRGARR